MRWIRIRLAEIKRIQTEPDQTHSLAKNTHTQKTILKCYVKNLRVDLEFPSVEVLHGRLLMLDLVFPE